PRLFHQSDGCEQIPTVVGIDHDPRRRKALRQYSPGPRGSLAPAGRPARSIGVHRSCTETRARARAARRVPRPARRATRTGAGCGPRRGARDVAKTLILDSEAISALAHATARPTNALRARAILQVAYDENAVVRVPTPVLAEVCRGGARDAAVDRVL